ncbi:hypothetical protein, partial [Halalkalibacter flavus]|uniref:hypothetical protein n=1 Tax=Halalkalibacter flavus TaxID=3090668 RepID=UPI002FCB05A7
RVINFKIFDVTSGKKCKNEGKRPETAVRSAGTALKDIGIGEWARIPIGSKRLPAGERVPRKAFLRMDAVRNVKRSSFEMI